VLYVCHVHRVVDFFLQYYITACWHAMPLQAERCGRSCRSTCVVCRCLLSAYGPSFRGAAVAAFTQAVQQDLQGQHSLQQGEEGAFWQQLRRITFLAALC
jgi:hypothetical protein